MHYVINKLKSQIEKQKATLLDDEESALRHLKCNTTLY
ncbi:hypothetical protein Psal006b_00571 [Piscirickettsia salmonis]|uniref:Uncharacterized protein n=1 Tax=Piscirickettsia salmonis TaxID=1238 RepID=A0AAC8VJT7_PISSA|nr:hypothetical protein KU39_2621 [Piscirickettsia salmonis]QGN97616.1 hypothetical protein Psal006b_00571 [Piscirickettsia salmonis]QGO01209.1 hypothetical protein Psal008_00569 [Piscirickettsia salmonis]QGO11934.1 hypothetical protein Psal010b_00570 [Piscirickettsia salmonis]QGO18951.1 hypothetical protein Psal013_00565 [Piscirickettsia salmonis]